MKFDIQRLTTRWPKVLLGDVVDFLDSKRKPIKASDRKPGPYPYYGANGLQDRIADYLFDEKLVMLAEDGGYFFDERPIAYIAEGKFWVNNHAHVLRAHSSIIPEFLNYHVGFLDVKPFLSGSTRAKLTKSDAARIELMLPPLVEQRRIVDVLSRAEGIVRLRREAQRKAAELVPALFLDMFGDPASNPKGWQWYRVDELLERFEGGKNLQAGDDESATYRILKISAVTSGRYIESESKPAPSDLVPAESHFIRTGDLLISRANTEALVGATAVVEITDGRTLLPDKLWRFVWRGDATIEPRFALHLLQQPAMRNKLSQLASGTGGSMKNISQAKLKTLELPVPPVELQREFAAKADAIRAIAARQATALATAQATFDALLHQAFAARQPG